MNAAVLHIHIPVTSHAALPQGSLGIHCMENPAGTTLPIRLQSPAQWYSIKQIPPPPPILHKATKRRGGVMSPSGRGDNPQLLQPFYRLLAFCLFADLLSLLAKSVKY